MNELKNLPAVKFTLLFVSGILIGSEFLFSPVIMISIILIFILLIFILYRRENLSALVLMLISLLIMSSGIFKANADFFYSPANSIRYIPDTRQNFTNTLTGIVKDIPDYDSTKIRFIVECVSLISGYDTIPVTGDVIAEIRKNRFNKKVSEPPVLETGDKVSLKGKLSSPSTRRNPGEFDYKKYLEIHNIHKIFYVTGYERATVLSKLNLSFFYQDILIPVKLFVIRTIDKTYTGDEASYLKGLITGERSDISAEMKNDFVNAGVMHLIAVSGLNVAYIIISLTLILSLFRIPLKPRVTIIIAFLIFYCLFTGSTASIVRASIMGILVLIAVTMERRIIFYNIIGVAAMIILIHDSRQLFDPGFILSFSATLSMAVFLNAFERMFISRIRELNYKGKKLTLVFAALLFTSLAAQIGTIPITADYFGKISVISLPANILAVPLANLSLAIGFFQMGAAAVSEYLSSVISETNNILLNFQLHFIHYCASLDFAYVQISDFDMTDILSFYLIIILMITGTDLKNIYFRVSICILILSANLFLNHDFKKKLRVTFLDIGQGDCALIQTPDDKNILVDCGRATFTFNSGERTIAPYLIRNSVKRIDLLIITHLHLDHIGGINYILENFEVGKIIESGQKYSTPFIDKMDSLINARNIPREVVRSGNYIKDIDDTRLYFLFPGPEFVNEEGNTLDDNLNNGSVAFILKYRETDFFFSGDIEKESERYLYDSYSDFLKTDVLKVAHHGSITSSTVTFIIKNRPSFAVISCGMNNKFNHPSDIVLNRLEKTGAEVFRTDIDKAVLFESDGKNVEFINWK